jgi:hypothetical protein
MMAQRAETVLCVCFGVCDVGDQISCGGGVRPVVVRSCFLGVLGRVWCLLYRERGVLCVFCVSQVEGLW